MRIIKVTEMQLGDVVRPDSPANSKFADATVKNITADAVHLFRPYVQTADFSYTGGVICYIGIEEYSVHLSSPNTFLLVQRLTTPLK
jgi:hypothetical protein